MARLGYKLQINRNGIGRPRLNHRQEIGDATIGWKLARNLIGYDAHAISSLWESCVTRKLRRLANALDAGEWAAAE